MTELPGLSQCCGTACTLQKLPLSLQSCVSFTVLQPSEKGSSQSWVPLAAHTPLLAAPTSLFNAWHQLKQPQRRGLAFPPQIIGHQPAPAPLLLCLEGKCLHSFPFPPAATCLRKPVASWEIQLHWSRELSIVIGTERFDVQIQYRLTSVARIYFTTGISLCPLAVVCSLLFSLCSSCIFAVL